MQREWGNSWQPRVVLTQERPSTSKTREKGRLMCPLGEQEMQLVPKELQGSPLKNLTYISFGFDINTRKRNNQCIFRC